MSRLSVNPDGSANVGDLMARCFLPMNHLQVDTLSLDILSNLCISYATEHNWLKQPTTNTTESHTNSNTGANEQNTPSKQEDGDDTSYFYVGVECSLEKPFTAFNLPITHTSLHIMGKVFLTSVGRSSVGLHVDLYSYSEDKQEEQDIVGRFNVTCVNISKTKRIPVPLSHSTKAYLETILASTKLSIPEQNWKKYTLPRIDAKSIIDRAAGCLDKSVDGGIARKLIRTATLPGNVVWSSYRRKHTLRESDIDYNLHFNQYRMIQLVSDAFRGAAGDGRCILSRLIPPDQSYIVGDLLIRELRIDYIKEVPMDMDAVEVHLFVASKEDEAIIEKYSKEHTLQHRITVHFVCRAYPTYDSLEGVYPASVGTLKVAV